MTDIDNPIQQVIAIGFDAMQEGTANLRRMFLPNVPDRGVPEFEEAMAAMLDRFAKLEAFRDNAMAFIATLPEGLRRNALLAQALSVSQAGDHHGAS